MGGRLVGNCLNRNLWEEETLVPRQLTMKTVGIAQGEIFGKLFQNQRPVPPWFFRSAAAISLALE
jgi:hypothetical protein